MKIFFIAMSNSMHMSRWLSQIADQGWEIFLFPVYPTEPHPAIRNITVFGTNWSRPVDLDGSVCYVRWSSIYFSCDSWVRRIKHQDSNTYKEMALLHAIQSVKPDIVHSLEFQHAGYMTLAVKEKLGKRFPIWIATSWGSDLYLYGRLAEHRPKVESIITNCDYYSCDCQRDILLAKNLGLKGNTLPIFPGYGGFDLEKISTLKGGELPASRRTILLKGYQGWAGRALVGLRALAMCADQLKGYRVKIYSIMSTDVAIAAELFSQDTQIPVDIIPRQTNDDDILRAFGRARIAISLSISDGLPRTMLEAMAMGAFPIQSCTACVDEWIENGKNGFIVLPEDPGTIAKAIRKALADDNLVNRAAKINEQIVRERLDYYTIKSQVVKMYQDIYKFRKE